MSDELPFIADLVTACGCHRTMEISRGGWRDVVVPLDFYAPSMPFSEDAAPAELLNKKWPTRRFVLVRFRYGPNGRPVGGEYHEAETP